MPPQLSTGIERRDLGHTRRGHRGLFITFEGVEGSGKTTQISRLAEWLEQQGRIVLRTREPGGTPAGEQIRQVLLDHRNTTLTAHTEAFLVLAARVQHLHEVIRPALAQGAIVLCDRFVDSTLAYQGYGRGLNIASLRRLNRVATQGLEADLTILFDVPVATGLARRRSHRYNNRLDVESDAFHIKIRKGFLQLAKREPDRIKVVDAGVSPVRVSDAVIQLVTPLIRRRPTPKNLLANQGTGRKSSMMQVG